LCKLEFIKFNLELHIFCFDIENKLKSYSLKNILIKLLENLKLNIEVEEVVKFLNRFTANSKSIFTNLLINILGSSKIFEKSSIEFRAKENLLVNKVKKLFLELILDFFNLKINNENKKVLNVSASKVSSTLTSLLVSSGVCKEVCVYENPTKKVKFLIFLKKYQEIIILTQHLPMIYKPSN
jgi:hypothetical protein